MSIRSRRWTTLGVVVMAALAPGCAEPERSVEVRMSTQDPAGDMCCEAESAPHLDLVKAEVEFTKDRSAVVVRWLLAGDAPAAGANGAEPTWQMDFVAPGGVVQVKVSRRGQDRVFVRRYGRGRNRSSAAPEHYEAGVAVIQGKSVTAEVPLSEFARIDGDVKVTAATYQRFPDAIGFKVDDQKHDEVDLGVVTWPDN